MQRMLVAVVALVVSAGAHADWTFNLGTIPGTSPIGNTVSGLFTDTFNFDVASASTATVVVLNTSYVIAPPGITLGNIAVFSGALDGTPLQWSTSSTPIAPGISQEMQTLLSQSPMAMAAGPHSLVIFGTADPGSQYTGSITVSAVPEPETYALMLAGLGAIGYLARRRKR